MAKKKTSATRAIQNRSGTVRKVRATKKTPIRRQGAATGRSPAREGAPKGSVRKSPKSKVGMGFLQVHGAALAQLKAPLALGIGDLDLSPDARAAAESLVQQFGAKIIFTSGRRDISQQAAAMAPHVVKDRQWIKKTYSDPVNAAELQKWVDDHPEATTAAAIAAGLKSVMSGWAADKLRRLSWHLTGDAFDIQPVPKPEDDPVTKAIHALPHFNKFLPKEGNDIVWHVQIE